MKKLLIIPLIVAFCFLDATYAQQDGSVTVRHENPVIAREINPTTLWFIHTAWYERAGEPVTEEFRRYSAHGDSMVNIVYKEASIPLAIAQSAYLQNRPQRFNATGFHVTANKKTLGLTGIEHYNYREATYSKAGIISTLKSTEKPSVSIAVAVLLLGLIITVCVGVFKFKQEEWGEAWENRNYAAYMFGFAYPCVITLAHYLKEIGTQLSTFQMYGIQFGWIQVMGYSLLTVIIWGYINYLGNIEKWHWFINLQKKLGMTTWVLIAVAFSAMPLHAYTGSWFIVLVWITIAFLTRVILYGIRNGIYFLYARLKKKVALT